VTEDAPSEENSSDAPTPDGSAYLPPLATEDAKSGQEKVPEELEVAMEPESKPEEGQPGTIEQDQSASVRRTLSLPRPIADAQIRLWRRSPGEERPTEEILSLFKGLQIAKVTIRDPYALATYSARRSQIEFLQSLRSTAGALESIMIEYAPEAEGDLDDVRSRTQFGSDYLTSFGGSAPRLALVRRSKKTRDDDFHDRFIEVDVRHAGGAIKRHELTIGRGVEALYNDRRQCTVTYAPPGSA